jgi:GxxExxY protein
VDLLPAATKELVHRETTGVILGAFYAVHAELGSGFLEAVYGNALSIVLAGTGLRVERQVAFDILFHGQSIGFYRADLIVDSRIVVEIKAGRAIVSFHSAQLLNYLRASRLEVGLLLNFGQRPEFKRVVRTANTPPLAARD